MIPRLTLVFASLLLWTTAFSQPILIGARSIYTGISAGSADSQLFVHSHGRNSLVSPITNAGFSNYSGFSQIVPNFDTCWILIDAQDSLNYYQFYTREYDSNNVLTTSTEFKRSTLNPGTYDIKTKTTYHYHAQLLDSAIMEEYEKSSGIFTPIYGQYYYYNANNKIVEYKTKSWVSFTQQWVVNSIDSTWYDTQGKVSMYGYDGNIDWNTGFVSHYNTLHWYTYNTNDVIVRDSALTNGSGTEYKDYIYNGQGRLDTRISYKYYQNNWQTTIKNTYYYTLNGNLSKIEDSAWSDTSNKFNFDRENVFTYNNFNQLTKAEYLYYPVWLSTGIKKYYYGQTNDIKVLDSDIINMQLYPVPATVNTIIELSFKTPQNFSVSIYNMQGAVVKQWKEKATKDYKKTIELHDLPSGMYTVQIATQQGVASKQLMIIK